MAERLAPRVFLSHTHGDKPVARVLVRHLTAHGVPVWLDERELVLGTELMPAIRAQIEASDVLVVVASAASATSAWVVREIACARAHGKPVVPFFVDPVTRDEAFRDFLGVDATSPQAFAEAVHALMRNLFAAIGAAVPPPDRAVLEAGLRELAHEEPALAPLILGCLGGPGLHGDNVEGAYAAPFHRLDDAVNGLYDREPSQVAASHAAHAFARAGAGSRALAAWVAATGDGDGPLEVAVGTRPLEAGWLDAAIRLLEACARPNDPAIAGFIDRNAALLTAAQRAAARRLVTWPVRGPERGGARLGWTALVHFPEADEIPRIWARWIRDGAFDGQPCAPAELARTLADAHRDQIAGREQLDDAIRGHVRAGLRSGRVAAIHIALTHLDVTARLGAPVASVLLREADTCLGSAEWTDWAGRELEDGARLRLEVETVITQAWKAIASGTCGAG